MVNGLWIAFGLLMVGLILRVRFYREPDEFCEFCSHAIDTGRDNFYSTQFVVELGLARALDEWFFCSYECQQMHLERFASEAGNV